MLRFVSSPDFENPQGGGTGNDDNVDIYSYSPGFRRRRNGHDRYAKAVTVEVTNVEEAGTIMLSTLQPQVDVGTSLPR